MIPMWTPFALLLAVCCVVSPRRPRPQKAAATADYRTDWHKVTVWVVVLVGCLAFWSAIGLLAWSLA